LLEEIKKGATPEQMVEGANRAKEAGFEVSLYVLAGIGERKSGSSMQKERQRS